MPPLQHAALSCRRGGVYPRPSAGGATDIKVGLTPQAMNLSPLRGFVYFSTVEFGAVSFVKTELPQRHRVHREQHRGNLSGGVGDLIEML